MTGGTSAEWQRVTVIDMSRDRLALSDRPDALVAICRHLIEDRSLAFHHVGVVVGPIRSGFSAISINGKTVDRAIAMPPVKFLSLICV